MSERRGLRRDAVTRARFFLEQARSCKYSGDRTAQEAFEAYMEAAIIFGRGAIHRLKKSADRQARKNPTSKAEVDAWWNQLLGDPAIKFFREQRDFILKEGPPKVGQIVRLGENAPQNLEAYYYYENPDIPATDTIERHLNTVAKIVTDAEGRFGTSSLNGQWWKDLE